MLTLPLERSTGPYQRSLLSLRMRSRSSLPSHASSSVDLMVAVSCGLTLQICQIIALSFHCRHWRLGFVNGQVSLAWSIALHTQELYTLPHVLKVAGRENWYQLLELLPGGFHTWSKAHNHRLLRACLLGSKWKLPLPACQVYLDFPLLSAILETCSSLALCTPVIRVLCQAHEPTAFLMHPVLTAFAEDAVAAHSSATDSSWELA